MKKTHRKIVLWSLVLLWMAVIFSLSAQNGAESADLSARTIRLIASVITPSFAHMPQEQQMDVIANLQHFIRKTAHVTAYFVLGILCLSALLQHPMAMKRRVLYALALSVGYAVTDEFHQLFVDGRGSQIADVGIDSCGALAGVMLVVLIRHLWLRRKRPVA